MQCCWGYNRYIDICILNIWVCLLYRNNPQRAAFRFCVRGHRSRLLAMHVACDQRHTNTHTSCTLRVFEQIACRCRWRQRMMMPSYWRRFVSHFKRALSAIGTGYARLHTNTQQGDGTHLAQICMHMSHPSTHIQTSAKHKHHPFHEVAKVCSVEFARIFESSSNDTAQVTRPALDIQLHASMHMQTLHHHHRSSSSTRRWRRWWCAFVACYVRVMRFGVFRMPFCSKTLKM